MIGALLLGFLASAFLNVWAVILMADKDRLLAEKDRTIAELEQDFQIERSKRVILKPEPRR